MKLYNLYIYIFCFSYYTTSNVADPSPSSHLSNSQPSPLFKIATERKSRPFPIG